MKRLSSQFDDQRISASPATPSCCCCCCCCVATVASAVVATREIFTSELVKNANDTYPSWRMRAVGFIFILLIVLIFGVFIYNVLDVTHMSDGLLFVLSVIASGVFGCVLLQALWRQGVSRVDLLILGAVTAITFVAEVPGAALGVLMLDNNHQGPLPSLGLLAAVGFLIPTVFMYSLPGIRRQGGRVIWKHVRLVALITLSIYGIPILMVIADRLGYI